MQEKDQSAPVPDGDAELRAFLSRVREALEVQERSQSDLARTLGVRPATVSDWFTGRSVPSGLIMLRLPAALGVRPGWLFTGRGPLTEPDGDGERSDGAGRVVAQLRSLLKELEDGE